MKKLFYIANIRIPTERAHSVQVMKMCEAMAEDREVELVIPNKSDNIGESNVFEYYGVKDIFKIKRIKSTDLLGKTMWLGKLFYWVDILTFLASLYLTVRVKEGDIIYSRDPMLLLPFLNKKCSVWVEIHDIPAYQPFFWSVLSKADGIVAITKHLKDMLVQKGLQANRITVAPDAVDLRNFDISISKEAAKDRLVLPQDKKIVMYIGLFDEWKGYQTLLEASGFFAANTQLVMIGGEKDQVDLLRKKYPAVKFLGFRPYRELAQNQKAADILVIPNSGKTKISKYFTSPLKLFAHMASSVPIVASDLPSLREIIDESMANFFRPDDSKDLARVITSTLSNYDNALRKAEQSLKAVEDYSWQKRVQNIMNFIE